MMPLPNNHYNTFVLLSFLVFLRQTCYAGPNQCRAAAYDLAEEACRTNSKMPGEILYTYKAPITLKSCATQCTENESCQGINVESDTTCHLTATSSDSCEDLDYEEGTVHYRKIWTNDKCTPSVGSSIHPTKKTPRCSGGWNRIYMVSESGIVIFGSWKELHRILTTGVSVRLKTVASDRQVYLMESTYFLFQASQKVIAFVTPPEQLGAHKMHKFVLSDGTDRTYNMTSGTYELKYTNVTVYIQSSCLEGARPVYDRSSIGDINDVRAWQDAQRKASTFIIQTKENNITEIFVTSSTIYQPSNHKFAAITKTAAFYSPSEKGWDTRMFLSTGITYREIVGGIGSGKGNARGGYHWIHLYHYYDTTCKNYPQAYKKYQYTESWTPNFIDSDSIISKRNKTGLKPNTNAHISINYDHPITWYAENCREKIFEISSGGNVHPRFNYENLQNELYNVSSAPVFIKVEGDILPPYDVITFQPDLIVCNIDKSVCEALSVGNPEISNGILNADKPDLEISSLEHLDYVYKIKTSNFDYFEVQGTKTFRQRSSFRKVTWYKSTRPYSLVYESDYGTGKITGNIGDAIQAGADLILVITDHDKNEVQIWRINRASIIVNVQFFILHTHEVLRPLIRSPKCPDDESTNWKFTLHGMSTRNVFLLQYIWDSKMKTQCQVGQVTTPFSLAIYASQF